MNNAWIGVIGTLLGVSIGGLVTLSVSYFQFKRDKKLKEQQLIQRKLEEICETAEEINRYYTSLMSEAMMSIYLGKKVEITTYHIPLNKIKMLIYFYAKNLKGIYIQLNEVTYIHTEAMIHFVNADNNREKRDWYDKILKLNKLMQKLCTALIQDCSNIVSDHFENKIGFFKKQI
ncbi:MAG: hypothetical protein ACYDIC_05775 [Desulfobaccales bacterium]